MTTCGSCGAALEPGAAGCAGCGATVDLGYATRLRAGPPPVAAHLLAPGSLLGRRYRIVARLGRGGMGEVYRADDVKLGQAVALKLLPPELASDAGLRQRFHDEVRVARRVTHPSVCRVHDIGEADGLHFLVMELVEGEDLASLLKRLGPPPVARGVAIARDLCAALAAVHGRGVLHRDLKPANVLIDGEGRARLADFGLAVANEPVSGEIAGTPAYMAPEQLAGAPASVASDLYALGLVLAETFTGERLFHGGTLADLRAQHASAPKPALGVVPDLPPALERAILRCLAEDPRARPASAADVLAEIPGGDPLQAAIDAGETPSPAMVAAAGEVGGLPRARAAGLLLLTLLSIALLVPTAGFLNLARHVPLPLSPAELRARAESVVVMTGSGVTPADRAHLFAWDAPAVEQAGARWAVVAGSRPSPLYFHYRQSPRRMVAASADGRVSETDPPLVEPGMVAVTLEPDGRLRAFTAVPPRYDASEAGAPPSWDALLQAAGFDPARLRSAAPRWTALVDTDRRLAWEGPLADRPDVTLRAEAGSLGGRRVWFRVVEPGAPSPAGEGRRAAADRVALPVVVACLLLAQAGALVLAFRNLRSRRGDRRGAFRVALVTFGAATLAGLLRASHVSSLEEYEIVRRVVAEALYLGALLWTFYLALEPLARRTWPRTLIAWSRLLQGRWRDPMVGRDVLYGVLAGGVLVLVVVAAAQLVARAAGTPPLAPRALPLAPLSGSEHLLYVLVRSVAIAILQAVLALCALVLLRVALRREWAAQVSLAVAAATYAFAELRQDTLAGAVLAGVAATLLVLLLVTRGLLVIAVGTWVVRVAEVTPFTADLSAWYAGRSLVTLAALLGLAVFGFVVASRPRPTRAPA